VPHLRRSCVLVLRTQCLPFAMLRAGARANLCRASGAREKDGIAANPGPGLKPVLYVRDVSRRLKAPLPRLKSGASTCHNGEIHRSQRVRGDGAAVLTSRSGARPRKYFWMRSTKGRAEDGRGGGRLTARLKAVL